MIQTLRNITLCGLVAVLALTTASCSVAVDPRSYVREQHPADQVFVDFNGYRVAFTKEDGEVEMRRYMNNYGIEDVLDIIAREELSRFINPTEENVRIYRDLQSGERGYAQVLHFRGRISGDETKDYNLVEIHIPLSQNLSPGVSSSGGKFPRYGPMGEL